MKSQLAVISFLLGGAFLGLVAGDSDGQATFSEHEVTAYSDYVRLLDFLAEHMEEVTSEEQFEHLNRVAGKTDKHLLGFSFENCDSPRNEQVVPSFVKLRPDPLRLPGNITVSAAFNIKKKVTSPVQIALTVWKKIWGFWIKVPCLYGYGSCSYDDFCSMRKVKKCPEQLVKSGLGCQCPFPAGRFFLKPFNMYVKAEAPVSGELAVRVEAAQGRQVITCAEVYLDFP